MYRLKTLTQLVIANARSIAVSDGEVSVLVWINPKQPADGEHLFVEVTDLTLRNVDPIYKFIRKAGWTEGFLEVLYPQA